MGSRSFNASHRRSTGWLLLWWWAVVVFMLIIEGQLYYCNGRSTVLLEDRLCYRKIKYHWKMYSCVGRSTVLLADKLYYWKINCETGRSVVFSEDKLYWRQSTGIDGNYRSRKITARRWLHKYVGAECGASSFTWYLYQMCNTDVRLSHIFDYVFTMFPSLYHHEIFRSYYHGQMSMQKVKVRGQRSRSQRSTPNLAVSGL